MMRDLQDVEAIVWGSNADGAYLSQIRLLGESSSTFQMILITQRSSLQNALEFVTDALCSQCRSQAGFITTI